MDSTESVTPTPAPAPAPAEKPASSGTLIGILVILLIVVAGAWYMWNQKNDAEVKASDVSALEEQGTSTDAAAIESDLSAQSPDNFDSGVDEAFANLDAAFDAQ